MRVLGVDPSSTCTGVAIVEWPLKRPFLVAAERLTGKGTGPLGYVRRVEQMADALADVIAEFAPDRAVVEMPHGRRHRRMGNTNMASLAIYGVAAGWLYGVVARRVAHVRPISVADLRTTKAERQKAVLGLFPSHRWDRDRGGDVADATFLALSELEILERKEG